MKVLLISNTAWSIVNFRSGLIRELIASGYGVVAAAPPDDEYVARIEMLGAEFISLPIDNKGINPGRDLLLLLRIYRVFRRVSPDAIITYTIKPVIYASFIARFFNICAISVITGLGTVFIKENLITKLVEVLYRLSQRRVWKLFFLNQDDMKVFQNRNLTFSNRMTCLPGEGVDLDFFYPAVQPLTTLRRPFRFLLFSRMLWDKGVGEYVEAAKLIHESDPDIEFCLMGFLDVKNTTAISRKQMNDWVADGVVNYLGVTDDMVSYIKLADCVVLPSYREGISRALLEAAAMGKPIVATDVVGCREVVDDGVNGFLCDPKSAKDLALKMKMMLSLSTKERDAMGKRGREKVVNEFDEKIVIQIYLKELSTIGRKYSSSPLPLR